ncbi:HK97 family phage prohead protease [Asticcacaulis sp. AC460]|uniref:HK97 family phage prohead protease n=1 Tax=Asticcacaulis sp. AC460 TaxID=1282360 RepID=UPI0012DCDBB0|nr:HK97 family phage prohead protease [Asticcacaulis sp. AC460]
MKHVPSAGVVEYRFVASEVEAEVAGRVDGFACPFDTLDSHDTRFAPGCFLKSIAAWKSRGRTLPMYVNHADNRPVGGWLDLAEGLEGLRAVGEIVSTEREWVGGLFRMKVVLGMSIGFVPVAWRVETDGSVTFTEVSLREISLVTANSVPGAVIESLRAEAGFQLPRTKRDFEHLLKRIGFSGNAARAITSSGFKEADLREGADPTGLVKGLQDQLFLMRLSHVARQP